MTALAASAQTAPETFGPPLLASANPTVQRHLDAARMAAESDWGPSFNKLCNLAIPNHPDGFPMRDQPITMPEVPDWPERPAKIFDNVYFVGSKAVSAFAITTTQGIIITDAMWSYDVAKSVAGGLTELGFNPHDIRYVIIPHGHPDHYGGAQYLHDQFGAKIVAPRGDLALIAHGPTYDTTPIPKGYDVIIDDGDSLTLGETKVRFTVMPGHSPGGVVMTFPVTQQGKRHNMLIWSAGGEAPGSTDGQTAQAEAIDRLLKQVGTDRVDALGDNHGSHLLVGKMRSNPKDGNPFLIGQPSLVRYLTVRKQCNLARAAQAAALAKPL